MKNIIESLRSTLLEANSSYRIVESYKGEQPEVFHAALHTLCSNVKKIRTYLAEETCSAEEEMTDRALYLAANLSQFIPL